MMTPSLPCIAALLVAGAAASTDARSGHIPNSITVPPLILAPLAFGVWGGLAAAGMSLLAMLVCGLVPYAMFRLGGAGGGDVKLLAALGAIGGPGLGLEAQLFGFACASFYALAQLAWRGRLLVTLWNTLLLVASPFRRARRERSAWEASATIRLGVPIFVGTAIAVWLRGAVLGA